MKTKKNKSRLMALAFSTCSVLSAVAGTTAVFANEATPETTAENTVETPVVENTVETTAVENTVENTAETTQETPAVETPAENTTETPADNTVENTTENTEVKPEETPAETGEEKTEETPSETPVENTEEAKPGMAVDPKGREYDPTQYGLVYYRCVDDAGNVLKEGYYGTVSIGETFHYIATNTIGSNPAPFIEGYYTDYDETEHGLFYTGVSVASVLVQEGDNTITIVYHKDGEVPAETPAESTETKPETETPAETEKADTVEKTETETPAESTETKTETPVSAPVNTENTTAKTTPAKGASAGVNTNTGANTGKKNSVNTGVESDALVFGSMATSAFAGLATMLKARASKKKFKL
jgi:outer membrane biosynthesis protein TonB